tara:strand:+ start:450 stop:1529 length:1080 start_codon:yes stop_codon:yes gene_type:complete
MSNNKQNLGQFYTTNYKHILQNLNIPSEIKNIIEPFAGNGDLINFIDNNKTDKNNVVFNVEYFDIDPKKEFIIKRDTLLNPPEYDNKFIITNPPYLARNKSNDKTIFNKYNMNDLYKCFISNIIDRQCLGGILIIPLNFWCSIRNIDIDLRKNFFKIYGINFLNIFEEKVFDDTSYTICSFQFYNKNYLDKDKDEDENEINCMVFPAKNKLKFNLNDSNNYTIGGEIYNLNIDNKIKVERLTKNNINSKFKTNILAKCIDDNINNKLGLTIINNSEIDKYTDKSPNLTGRSYAVLVIEPGINLEKQKNLVSEFNKYLNIKRNEFNSLFLTNYRESNSIARKRISFKLVFDITNFILQNL